MKISKITLLLLFGIISVCCRESDSNASELSEVLPGFWHFQETDSSYAEVVFTDKIYWAYDDKFGVIAYDYKVTTDDSVKRFYKGSGNLFSSFKVQKFADDSIWAVNDSNFKFVLRRIDLSLNPEEVVTPKSSAADNYVSGYRERKLAFNNKSR